MLVFIETIIILTILIYLYKLIFKNVQNPLRIPMPLAIAILIVGFLVLPSPIKALMVVILIVANIVYVINKNRSQINDSAKTI